MSTQLSSENKQTGFEPKVVAFVCKWCTYAGADLAGTNRLVYPPNVRTLMLPCTGRIDVAFVIRAFMQGADGVLVSGCHPGDCHYTAGNFRARRRWMLLRDLLDVLGFDLRRLDMAWISAAEGAKWVKTISAFTDKIRDLGPYDSFHKIAQTKEPAMVPAIDELPIQKHPKIEAKSADEKFIGAIAESLSSGRVKAVVGWAKNKTLGKAKPTWITSASAATEMTYPGDASNLARLIKHPKLKDVLPIGVVARTSEVMSLNVMSQESQIDPEKVVVFAIGADGNFLGTMPLKQAANDLAAVPVSVLPAERPAGFSDETLASLDELMKKTPEERFAFWTQQSARCIKCYACRNSCPMCNCELCYADKNQPQWFPTAADGPGNLSWHIMRSFHLAGRCVGCGACEAACPAGIPLNLISAALARSSMKHFNHRAGVDPAAVPLQSDYKNNDKENFIL